MILNFNLRHPDYLTSTDDWTRWYRAYRGGREFVNAYLKWFPSRENKQEYDKRREITYCPRFAGAAVDDVKNSIYQRMSDIVRVGGPLSYQRAMELGVDSESHSMNYFMGQEVLPELLVGRKVGVYVDAPDSVGPTMATDSAAIPYLKCYAAPDILNWSCDKNTLLVRNFEISYDDETKLANNKPTPTYKYYRLTDEGVEVYTLVNPKEPRSAGGPDKQKYPDVQPSHLLRGMKRIPFVIFELNKSLMEDIADYQIALLNLHSSDINYILSSNFPFYVEPFDPKVANQHARINGETGAERVEEVVFGPRTGRKYPMGANAPEFINPSAEPLKASMEKEEQIKAEIRHLLNLTLSQIEPKFASAESKGMDQKSLESGLAAIGEILENGEREIAEIWSFYDKSSKPATVNYPENYSLKSDAERRKEAESDKQLMTTVPSRTYQKEIAKRIARTTVGHIVSRETMEKIENEVDQAKYITADAVEIKSDLENGLVSDATASQARGYDASEVAQAKEDHAERIKRIQQAQTSPDENGNLENPAARGVKDLATNPRTDAKKEKDIAATK